MSQGSWQREQTGCKQQSQPGRDVACVNNCGFFGNDTTMNMCPNCYRAFLSSHADSTTLTSPSKPECDDKTVPISVQQSSSPEVSTLDISAAHSAIEQESSISHLSVEAVDSSLLSRAANVDPSAALEVRARFPRVQSASESDTVRADLAPESCDSFPLVLAPPTVVIPADSLIRTNASRALDVDMAPPVLAPLVKISCSVTTPVRPPSVASTSKPNRCEVCRKKVGLTGFKCRCKGLYCGSHRYSDKHSCTFDYKAAGRDAIARANPVVKADKVVRF